MSWQGILMAAQSAGEMPKGTILDFSEKFLTEVVIQWFNILLLSAVLILVLYKPVKKYLADRSERIRSEIEAVRKDHEEVLALKERYERMIEGVEKEREEILRLAHKKAVERSDKLLFDARHEADAMYDRALAEIELERKNVTDEMRRQMIDISTMIAGQFVEVSIDRDTQDRFIDEAFSNWEGL